MGINPHLYAIFGINDFKYDEKNWKCTDSRQSQEGFLWDREDYDYKIKLMDKNREDEDGMVEPSWYFNSLATDHKTQEIKDLGELVEWNNEYGESNVIGYKIGSIYDDDVLWVLSALHIARGGEQGDGHIVVPGNRDLSGYQAFWRVNHLISEYKAGNLQRSPLSDLKNIYRENRDIKMILKHRRRGWLYAHYDWIRVGMWRQVTRELFNQVGLTGVKTEEFKLILGWRWG